MVGVLGQQVDGAGSDLALCDSGDQTGNGDGHAGCEVAAAVHEAQACCGAVKQTHLHDGEEEYHQTVQTLGTGDDLKDHDLTELRGVLSHKAGARLAGNAGADTGACACEACCKTCAQKAYCKAGVLKQKFHFLFPPNYCSTVS